MTKKDRAMLVVAVLEEIYPNAACSLDYEKPYELLIAGRLSAQCTDARVNIVTKELFRKYPSIEDFANAKGSDIAEIIESCGLYKTKAKNIVEMARQILQDFDGQLPQTIDELTTLSGIGRKTANLIMGDIFRKPAIVTDTHCIRISGRLALTKSEEPRTVENDLKKLIPAEISSHFCHQIVQFGRDFCKAKSPLCNTCPIKKKLSEALGKEFSCVFE